MPGQDKLVGIGGMGCNEACAQVSVATSSMRRPSLDYDCAAAFSPDSEQLQNFCRVGTVSLYAKGILARLAKQYTSLCMAILVD